MNLAASLYAAREWVVVRRTERMADVVSRWWCGAIKAAHIGAAHRRDVAGVPGAPLDEGGVYRHWQLDGQQVHEHVPGLHRWYEEAVPVLTEIVGREVVVSPYPRSAVNVKVCGPGDEQGWHRDTNPLAVVIYLSPTNSESGTMIDTGGERPLVIAAEPGDVLVFNGRRFRHRVPPTPPGPPRVTAILNYYHPDDLWRPEGIDDLVYGRDVAVPPADAPITAASPATGP